jgi:hypothetical protein
MISPWVFAKGQFKLGLMTGNLKSLVTAGTWRDWKTYFQFTGNSSPKESEELCQETRSPRGSSPCSSTERMNWHKEIEIQSNSYFKLQQIIQESYLHRYREFVDTYNLSQPEKN